MRYLIDFKDNVSDDEIAAYFSNNNCQVIKEWDNFEKAYLVESNSLPPTTDLLEFVVEDAPAKIKPLNIIEVNPYIVTHSNPEDEKITVNVNDRKDWWKNYSYTQPEFEKDTLTLSRLGKGIKVYVMDSGIDSAHVEFENATIENLFTITPGDYGDNNGHGTAIASVIVGKTCGISNATIKNVKIFDSNHATLQSELISAFDAIIEDHVDNTFSILNCSWVIEKNPWVEHKLRMLIDEGVWVVASAGNNGSSIEDVTPASMYEVFTVGAYNQDLLPCNFSNFTGNSAISLTADSTNHGELDAWAPGEHIWVAAANNPTVQYGYVSGTSIAAGITSAIIAVNCTSWVKEDGTRYEGTEFWELSTINPFAIQLMVVSRENLLDLTDEKYKYSKNLLVTIIDKSKLAFVNPPDEHTIVFRVGMAATNRHVYEPFFTSKLELLDPWPSFVTVLPTGNLYLNPKSTDVDEGDQYKEYFASFKRFATDGTEELIKLKIYILAENINLDNIANDHEIKIILSQQTCFGGQFLVQCNIGSYAPTCLNNCAGQCCYYGFFQFDPGKSGLNCECTGYSDERLKSNVVKVGKHKIGVDLYEYDLFGKRRTGVMARDVFKIMPEAVKQDRHGYYIVDYAMINS